MTKLVKILEIDGGKIRKIIHAILLTELEKRLVINISRR
jgi:hypothetical protein